MKQKELQSLYDAWRNARDGMETAAEIGDRELWEEQRANSKSAEDSIFTLTGRRPPYAVGWGVDLSRSFD